MASDNEALVKFTNVDKTFDGETLVVKNLNLDIAKGEFLTLLGPSGSGKTTTLLMLAGFESITHGDIQLAGRSLKNVPPYRRDIGMVFQNYALFPHMTVEENLAFPLEARKVPKEEIGQKVARALDMVRLTEVRQAPPHPALRWTAAAGRGGPCAGLRTGVGSDGRAARRAGPPASRKHAVRVAPHSRERGRHRGLRDP